MLGSRKTVVLSSLLLLGVAACSDLEITNPNDPTREQALGSAGDVESLIAGAYNTWFVASYDFNGASLFLSTASFQHSAPWNNEGLVPLSRIPRERLPNFSSSQEYGNLSNPWFDAYSGLAAIADGLRALEESPELAAELDAEGEGGTERARAFGKFVQGLLHGTLAALYDQGFVIDETVDITQPQEAVPSTEMFAAASGYFDEAIALAEGADWEIPDSWMTVTVSPDELVRLAHSWRAIMRASLPRTADEAVDWQLVLDDIDAGITETFFQQDNGTTIWWNAIFDLGTYPTWGQMNYFIHGMADQSDSYQRWLATPVNDRLPYFGASAEEEPFLIITPDQRFAQGASVAEQTANPGEYYSIPNSTDWYHSVGSQWAQSARGTWRWSWYWSHRNEPYNFFIDFTVPHVTIEEMNLLRAEALFETGDPAGAAALVNITRTEFGLNATDAAGTNTSCVPRLPNEECGGLFEMLKWEKRLETQVRGLMGNSWYFDSRRWGDHYKGTFLQLPIPAGDLQTLGLPLYSFGGIDQAPPAASAGSSYAWPFEGD